MPPAEPLVTGEFRRSLDDRFRLSVPPDLLRTLPGSEGTCLLAKETPGALSLWNPDVWGEKLSQGIKLIEEKIAAGRLAGQVPQVQVLGRLLSTRHRSVNVSNRGRILIPEGFREFLGVQAGEDVMVVGAALCVEIWRPDAWLEYLQQQMPEFHQLYDELSA